MTNDSYENGVAEGILLRACRRYGTLTAPLILGYAAVGMPLQADGEIRAGDWVSKVSP